MSVHLAANPSFTPQPKCEPRPLGRGALLTTDFPPVVGGISNYLFNVYRQFDLGQMTLIAPQHPQAEGFDAAQSYTPRRFQGSLNVPGIRGAWQLWRMYAEAEKLIASDPQMVMHCGHVNAAMAARKLKRRYRTPYVLWTHALEIMDEWLRPSILPTLLDANMVVVNSEFTRRFVLSTGVFEKRVVKITPGADSERFRPGLDCRELARRLGIAGRPTLLTVARIVKANRYKNHDGVLRALAKVVTVIPDVAYVVAGDGDDLDYLRRVAEECGVAKNVMFTGHVSNEELPLLYNACDAFVLCSREDRGARGVLAEGFGLALLEASACGKPVIAGHTGGMPDAVLEGETGLLVNPNDTDQIASAILRILRAPEFGRALGDNGRQWVESEMNWQRAGDDFQRALEQFFPASVPMTKGAR